MKILNFNEVMDCGLLSMYSVENRENVMLSKETRIFNVKATSFNIFSRFCKFQSHVACVVFVAGININSKSKYNDYTSVRSFQEVFTHSIDIWSFSVPF